MEEAAAVRKASHKRKTKTKLQKRTMRREQWVLALVSAPYE